ncbi:hypothetical protein [Streptomyces lavendulocolor]|uniref:hypothetical protein n=1 Tax=Streptomyces lavendulocolor TaxID=67316 RepID=UPI003C2C81DF
MIEAVRDDALAEGLVTSADWERGIADLRRTAGPDGTFPYAFFKATAIRPVSAGAVP